MNRTSKTLLFSLATILSSILYSCNTPQKESNKENDLTFESESFSDSTLFTFEGKQLSCHFNGSIELPIEGDRSYDLKKISSIIKELYYKNIDNPIDSLSKEKFLEFDNYFNEMIEFKKKNNEEIDLFETRFEHSRNLYIAYNRNQLLSIGVVQYDYTGGAHGYESENYLNLDLLGYDTLTINRLFETGSSESIKNIIFETLLKRYKVSSLDELNEVGFFNISEIGLSENFKLENDSLQFIYNQYEIAPYSMGRIKVKLSYKDLSPYIREEYKLRFI